MIVSTSHSIGGSLKISKYLLYSLLISAPILLIFYPLVKYSNWISGLFCFWMFIIAMGYSIFDPKLRDLMNVRFCGLLCLLIGFVFSSPSYPTYYYSFPVQVIVLQTFSFVYLIFVAIWPSRMECSYSSRIIKNNENNK